MTSAAGDFSHITSWVVDFIRSLYLPYLVRSYARGDLKLTNQREADRGNAETSNGKCNHKEKCKEKVAMTVFGEQSLWFKDQPRVLRPPNEASFSDVRLCSRNKWQLSLVQVSGVCPSSVRLFTLTDESTSNIHVFNLHPSFHFTRAKIEETAWSVVVLFCTQQFNSSLLFGEYLGMFLNDSDLRRKKCQSATLVR